MFTPLLSTRGLSTAATFVMAAFLAVPAVQAQTIDGTRDASYPTPLAVQTNPTGFGDSSVGMTGGANGDELDNISAQIVGSNLYLFIGGNLQTNNNHLEIFFDSKVGGQNKLVASSNATLTALDTLGGLKFDAGFNADYLLSVSAKGTNSTTAASFASINVFYGVVGANTGSYVGKGTAAATSAPLTFGTNTGAVAINNSNTAGVSGTAVGTPATVNTGLELMIPLAALGSSANGGDIKICAFVNGAKHDYVSNQTLAGLPNGTANIQNGATPPGYTGGATPVALVDFTAYAGNQYVTVTNGGPLATTTAQERAQVSVAPNPAQGRFLVQLPATVADLHLNLYNSLGQVVRQVSPSAGATSIAIEASGLATGVYLLRTMSGADAVSTQRVVLN